VGRKYDGAVKLIQNKAMFVLLMISHYFTMNIMLYIPTQWKLE